MSRVVIVGCGATGVRLARLHLEAGDHVTATTRAVSPLPELHQHIALDLDRDSLPGRYDVVHYHVPPPQSGGDDPRIGRFLAALAPPARLVYISATSVYGDHAGEWVDEQTPAQPDSDRGRRRLDAERQILEYGADHGVTVIILRAAGIYGTGRKRNVTRDPAAPLRPVNRIHVDDLAAIAFAAATRANAEGIYNCADGAPTMEPASSYSSEAKKIRARRIVRGLGVKLRYPEFVSDPE